MRGKPGDRCVHQYRRGITPAHAGKTYSATSSAKTSWDHPRACGENATLVTSVATEIGSPPRMRGKQSYIPYRFLGHRITPAHAGKTSSIGFQISIVKDHPRACGENGADLSHSATALGSPPRMRGKPQHRISARTSERITPAHAGKTSQHS